MEEELMKLKGDHHIPTKTLVKRLVKYVSKYWARFLLAFILICVNVALDIITPLFVKAITDYLASADMNSTVMYIISFSVGYFVLCLGNQVFLYLEAMLLQRTGQAIVYELRMEVFTHIENMSQNQFNDMPVGSLVTRVANYTTNMSDLFTTTLVSMLRNIFTIVGVYIIMITLSPMLSLVLFGFVIVVFIISFIFRNVISKRFRAERGYLSDLNTFLNENLG
ncbi:MAG: hypothetical protein J5880_01250, partial [Bacilli bacterium]|nr:hypothetical protein [Bacilli bacterium]